MANVGGCSIRWPTAMFRQFAPLSLLVVIFSTSCITVPGGGYKPYKDETTGLSVLTGVTTKDRVISKLGSPRSTLVLEDGSLLTYQESGVTRWTTYSAYGPPIDMGGVSYRYVLRVYLNDDNTVTKTNVTRVRSKKFLESHGCPATNLCYDSGRWMFLASRGMERRIRELAVPDDLCGVFIYSDSSSHFTIDDSSGKMFLNERSYVRRVVSPGLHRVCGNETEFEFECEAGRQHFLRVEAATGMQLVAADVGREETRSRRLLLNDQDPVPE